MTELARKLSNWAVAALIIGCALGAFFSMIWALLEPPIGVTTIHKQDRISSSPCTEGEGR